MLLLCCRVCLLLARGRVVMVLGVDMHLGSKGKSAAGRGRSWNLDLPVLVWVEEVEGDLRADEGVAILINCCNHKGIKEF